MTISFDLSYLSIGIFQGSRQWCKERKKLKILDEMKDPLSEKWGKSIRKKVKTLSHLWEEKPTPKLLGYVLKQKEVNSKKLLQLVCWRDNMLLKDRLELKIRSD